MRAKEEQADGTLVFNRLHAIWLMWFAGLGLGGPLVWILLYGFLNPPMTLAMAVESDRPVDRVWTPLSQISSNLIDDAIVAQDSDFCTHHGFDRSVIGESWRGTDPGTPVKSNETISLQTSKTVFLWSAHTWLRQVLEDYFTLLMEHIWSKKRIMEIYLNTAEWGDGVYGAAAAAQFYFHADISHLTDLQAARLVAVLPNPRQWSPLSDAPLIYYRTNRIMELGSTVRANGNDTCLVPHT